MGQKQPQKIIVRHEPILSSDESVLYGYSCYIVYQGGISHAITIVLHDFVARRTQFQPFPDISLSIARYPHIAVRPKPDRGY